jgi:hypothetical protein
MYVWILCSLYIQENSAIILWPWYRWTSKAEVNVVLSCLLLWQRASLTVQKEAVIKLLIGRGGFSFTIVVWLVGFRKLPWWQKKSKWKALGLGCGSSGRGLGSVIPWVQSPLPSKNQKETTQNVKLSSLQTLLFL